MSKYSVDYEDEEGWKVSVVFDKVDEGGKPFLDTDFLCDEKGEIIYFSSEEEARTKGIPEFEKQRTRNS